MIGRRFLSRVSKRVEKLWASSAEALQVKASAGNSRQVVELGWKAVADVCTPVGADELAQALRPRGRPLVINHWATWCEPCVDELPRLGRAHAGIVDVGDFIGVSWDSVDRVNDPAVTAAKVTAFADDHGVCYENVLFLGSKEELQRVCNLSELKIPQTIVLDQQGKIVWSLQGPVLNEDVFQLINAVQGAAARQK